LERHPQVFKAYISVLNLELLHQNASAADKWSSLVSILDQFHTRGVYTIELLSPIHNIVKTLRENVGTRSQKETWQKICKMLKHPSLVQSWANVLQAPAYRHALKMSTLKEMSYYDPTVRCLFGVKV